MYRKNNQYGCFKLLFYIKYVNRIIASVFYEDYIYFKLSQFTYNYRFCNPNSISYDEQLDKRYERFHYDFTDKSIDVFSEFFIKNILGNSEIENDYRFWDELRYKLEYRYLVKFKSRSKRSFIESIDNVRKLRNNIKGNRYPRDYKDLIMYLPTWQFNDFKFASISTSTFYLPIDKKIDALLADEKQRRVSVKRAIFNDGTYLRNKNQYKVLNQEHDRMRENYNSFKDVRYNFSNFVYLFSSIGNKNIKKILPKRRWKNVFFDEILLIHNFITEIEVLLWFFIERQLVYYIGNDYPNDYFIMLKKEKEDNPNIFNLLDLRNSIAHKDNIYSVIKSMNIESIFDFIPKSVEIILKGYLSKNGKKDYKMFKNDLLQRIDAKFSKFKIKQVCENSNTNLRRVNGNEFIGDKTKPIQILRMNYFKKFMSSMYKNYLEYVKQTNGTIQEFYIRS
ncbi:hypothetical protein CI105_08945 [Candidatus Izimaplasma bacterium ZiA1]|uniref:hypothetical protein n=1 Tax=Candidatus Izimoplasma sp. ZiA1 TaxID=2024899 RepID=UPI000BAA550B|nr:hypothetical protein CI105_08945 [Candidatus Izimaplasma bacterium ZiA1]